MECNSSGLTAVKLLLHLTLTLTFFLPTLFNLETTKTNCFWFSRPWLMPWCPHPQPIKGFDQRLQFRLRFQWPKLPKPHAKHWGNSEPRENGCDGTPIVTNPCVKSVTKVAWNGLEWLGRLEAFDLSQLPRCDLLLQKHLERGNRCLSITVGLRHRRVQTNAKQS